MKKITPEILERYFSDTCTVEEKKIVSKWLNAQEPQSNKEEHFLDYSWQKIIDTSKIKEPKFKANTRQLFIRTAGIAASLAFLIFAGVYSFEIFNFSTANEIALNEINFNLISAELGQRKIIELPDGSKVVLNSGSVLQVPDNFSKDYRIVKLNGHAHFNVHRDENRPFIIYTKNSKTQVLGTSFDVIADNQSKKTEVVVTSGKVRFSELTNEDNVVELTVDKQAALYLNNSIEVTEVVASHKTAWKDNILMFDNSSFTDIVKVLERWYAIEITVKDQILLKQNFTFIYDNPSLEEVFKRMSFVAKFNYTIDGNNILIY